LLESWLMEVRVYSAYRQGKISEMEAAWSRFLEKAAQAEVAFVQNKARVWVGHAYLDAGRTSEAQDTADEVIRMGRLLNNPMHLAHGLHLRGMVLHAWERFDEAQVCLDEAERIASDREVACWELQHSILLSLATLALDRGQNARARELAIRVETANANLELAHDLHCSRAQRILGQAALADGAVAAAVLHTEKAWQLASQTDDFIERARSLHYFCQALVANGEVERASQCRTECMEMFNQLGNTFQLRRLGYTLTDNPESVGDGSVLSRVIQLVSVSNSRPDVSVSAPSTSRSRQQTEREKTSLRDLALVTVREDTLVASDSSDSF
jgi:tetratricopeptide (TPR) repeat protein